MGCPDIYYKECVEHLINACSDTKNKENLSIDQLETIANEYKLKIALEFFYFNAGRAMQVVVDDCMCGNGDINAAICGTSEFMDFVGLEDY